METRHHCSSYEEAEKIIRQHEIASNTQFVFGTKTKGFGALVLFSGKPLIKWSDEGPYVVLGHFIKLCHLGKDRNWKNKALQKTEKKKEDHAYRSGRRFLINPSKKIDCPAKIYIREVMYLLLENKDRHKLKTQMGASYVPLKKAFFVDIPTDVAHNHPTGELIIALNNRFMTLCRIMGSQVPSQ